MIEKIVIAIPTYNEAGNPNDIIHGVLARAPSVNILIAGDNSLDGTGRLIEELGTKDSRIRVLHRQKESGLGPIYLTTFAWVSEHGYTWAGEFDTNGPHRPQDLPHLLAMARGTARPGLVIGSRWIRRDNTRGWSKKHELLSRAGSFCINMVFGSRVHDTTAGSRIYCVDFLNRLL